MKRPRLILADDHSLILDALKNLLEPEFEVVGTFSDGRTLVERAAELNPDVIVLDLEEKRPGHSAAGQQFADEADASGSRLIVLGKIRRGPVFTGGHVISKPYHFAPLVHTIERMAAKAA